MKVKEYFYNIKCDCCGEIMSEDWWNDSCDAQTIADDSNYLTCGDKHYCPDCYSVDDNDNYVTKDGHIYNGDTRELIQ